MLLMSFTQEGTNYVGAEASNGLRFHVVEVAYGSGGFNPSIPANATSININATTLSNEVFRQSLALGNTVRDEIVGSHGKDTTYTTLGGDEFQGVIGEAMIFAVVDDPGSSGVAAGTKFSLAVAHFSREIVGEHDRLAIRWPLNISPTLDETVAYWFKFEETSSPVYDSISGAAAVATGPVVYGVPGVVGNALRFNGGYIDTAVPSLNGPFTWAAWVKRLTNVTSDQFQYVIDQKQPGTNFDAGSGFILIIDDDSSYRPFVYSGAGNLNLSNPATAMAIGMWRHLTITYDEVYLRLYVDGVLEGTLPATNLMVNTTVNVRFGSSNRQGAPFGPSFMEMDEVRYYNRALSAPEINSLM